MKTLRPVYLFLLALCLTALSVMCQAQNYTSIVVFGDSLSDTGNFANLTNTSLGVSYPGTDFNYAAGRFTDSTATSPASQAYAGVWVEQVAAQFAAHPAVKDSLDGGTNYATGDATTQDGYRTVSIVNGFSVMVPNMGQQVTTYLATGSIPTPTPGAKTLFVVFGGANDLYADSSTAGVTAAAQRVAALVQRLIAVGGIDFMIPNLPPLGDVPEYNTGTNSLNAAAAQFRTLLAADLNTVATTAAANGETVHLYQPDLYTQTAAITAKPMTYALINVVDSAQGATTVDPDTYLYWDDVHPTTTGHHYIASAAENLLSPLSATTVVLTASPATVTAGESTALTATVTRTGSSVKPSGLVTFYGESGSTFTAIGAGALNASGSATISFKPAGSTSFTAVYAGDTADLNATSTPLPVNVGTPVATSTSITATSQTVNLGASVSFTATVSASAGVATGSVNFLDGSKLLGNVVLNGSDAVTYSTSALAAGSHSITATYMPSGLFEGSSSAATMVTVVSPSVMIAFSPSSLTVKHGSSGTVTVTATPAGGASGTITYSCGSLPTYASCSFSPASVTLNGSAAQSSTLTIATTSSASAMLGTQLPLGRDRNLPALALLPFAALALFGLRRKGWNGIGLLSAVLTLAIVGGLSGCGSAGKPSTAPGTYSVTVTATVAGTTNTTTQATLNVIVE